MELLTLAEAAKESPVSAAQLRQLCEDGTITATKMGKTWIVTRAAFERFRKADRPKPGPQPKGTKNKNKAKVPDAR